MRMWKSNETHIPGRTLVHLLADSTRPADRYEFANNCKSRSDPFTGSPDPLSVDKWPAAQLLSCLSIPQFMRYLRDVSNTPIIQPPSNAHYEGNGFLGARSREVKTPIFSYEAFVTRLMR
jgi:hypothetical protein